MTEGEEECSGCEEQLRPDGGDCGRTRAGSSAPPLLHQTHGAETAPKKAAPTTHRPGKGWGAVAAPFNSLLHTPKPTPQAQV